MSSQYKPFLQFAGSEFNPGDPVNPVYELRRARRVVVVNPTLRCSISVPNKNKLLYELLCDLCASARAKLTQFC